MRPAGVAFIARRVGEVWRTSAICEALDTTVEAQATGIEGGSGGALAVGGDQLGDVALIEVFAQAPRVLRLGLGRR